LPSERWGPQDRSLGYDPMNGPSSLDTMKTYSQNVNDAIPDPFTSAPWSQKRMMKLFKRYQILCS